MASFLHAFEDNYDTIIDKLDVSHGLLPKLRTLKVIENQHQCEIQAMLTEQEKAEKLVEILRRCSDQLLPEFCQALEETRQKHIVDLLSLSGPTVGTLTNSNSFPKQLQMPVVDDQCELCNEQHDYGVPWRFRCFIKGKEKALRSSLNVGGNFLVALKDVNILDDEDYSVIKSKGDDYSKREELLDRLRLCNDRKYDDFVRVLKRNNMEQIAGLMESHSARQTKRRRAEVVTQMEQRDNARRDNDTTSPDQPRRRGKTQPSSTDNPPEPPKTPPGETREPSKANSRCGATVKTVVLLTTVALVAELWYWWLYRS